MVREEIEDLILGYHITASDRFKVAEIKKLLHLKSQTTVGDLEPGAGDRIRRKDEERSSIYLRPESCLNLDEAIEDGKVIMMYEKDNSLCLMDKSTPCERVEDESEKEVK